MTPLNRIIMISVRLSWYYLLRRYLSQFDLHGCRMVATTINGIKNISAHCYLKHLKVENSTIVFIFASYCFVESLSLLSSNFLTSKFLLLYLYTPAKIRELQMR